MPGGSYFLYARAPKGCGALTFANAEEASQFLIQEQSVICVPWDNAGAYLRFAVTYVAKDEKEEDALMEETVRRLGRLALRF
jgi:LL-diaminopimelate aminotransferase